MALKKEEIQRKLLHFIFGTIIPVGALYIPWYAEKQGWNAVPPWTLPPIILGVFLAGFILMETLRFKIPAVAGLVNKLCGGFLRKEEEKRTTGATYINASALICTIIFKDHPYITFMVISTFIWGDAVAALVGQAIGKIKIGKKSLEGSLSCLALCLVFYFFVFPHVPLLLDKWSGTIPLAITIVASLCVTVLELIPMKITRNIAINDNLIVPVVTGIVMVWLYPLVK
jgi:diacylglycerol kinase (CTP)